MPRVVVLGCAGVGKTVFSQALARKFGCAFICLDEVWARNGREGCIEDFRASIEALHAEQDWVSDGNFSEATFDLRLKKTTHIIWIERPRWLCLIRAALRPLESGQAHRPGDIPRVLAFIWNFNRRNRPRIESLIGRFGPDLPVLHLQSDREVRSFLHSGFRKLIDNGVEGVGGEDIEQPHRL